jgi:glycosyltransferase involved in cell wall biosynthesis
MRIAYVCADRGVPVFGRKGCSVHVQELVRALRACGARVELFTPRGEGMPAPGFDDIKLHRLPFIHEEVRAFREKLALAANEDLQAALERRGPFDLVYERYSLWSFAGMEMAKTWGVPGLLEVNAPLIEEQAEHRGLVDRPGAERTARRVFRSATTLIAVSREVAAYLACQPGARGRVHIIPNGVDPKRFPPNPARAGSHGPAEFVVGFVGSLKRWHGVSILLEAFDLARRRGPRIRLLIVGDGPERSNLEADVRARGLSGEVAFTGAVAPEAVPGLLASMDVAVAPYPALGHFYFSPLKVFEYMAAGRATVASRVGQLGELLQDGVNALLCTPGDPSTLAEALLRLQGDRPLAERLGQAARSSALRDHTWEAVARRVLRLAKVELVGQS